MPSIKSRCEVIKGLCYDDYNEMEQDWEELAITSEKLNFRRQVENNIDGLNFFSLGYFNRNGSLEEREIKMKIYGKL